MDDLGKVNSGRLYKLWKNLTVGMLAVIGVMTLSKLLPYYLSPVVALLGAAFLYTYIYELRSRHDGSCMAVPYGMLYSLVFFAFVAIGLNMLNAWNILKMPAEFVFFTNPFIASLLVNPICFLVFLTMLVRRRKLHICMECSINDSDVALSGDIASLFRHEAHIQLKNLTCVFGLLSVLVWTYYFVFYVNININDRDWYIFTWVTIISVILDEIYFMARYYNLYLDLEDSNEIIKPEDLQDITAKTYLRYYVICGNQLYVNTHAVDPRMPYKEIIDTPFFTKRTVNGIGIGEVKTIIKKMTGYDGELRFFFGRKSQDIKNHSILRYFYFLDGDPSDYQNMNTDGEWMDYEKIKYLFSNNPGRLAPISVSDTRRLATIMLTNKIFDENGYRRSKIKMYNPSFNLIDVRKSNLDFQDDKWIKISMFNSDTPFYGLKRKWRKLFGGAQKSSSSWS